MFEQSKFATVGAQSAPSASVYSYTTDDDLSTVTTAGYFEDKQFQLDEGDWILLYFNDGHSALRVTSDTTTALPIDFSANLPAGGYTYGVKTADQILALTGATNGDNVWASDADQSTPYTYYNGSWYSTGGGVLV